MATEDPVRDPQADSEAEKPISRFERRRRENREALLEAALELFQQKGLKATKLEEICELADVSSRTFFNHFATRQDLYLALAEQRTHVVTAAFDAASHADGSLEERLVDLFRAIGRSLNERPAYRELIGALLTLPIEGGSLLTRSQPHGRSARLFIEAGLARGEVSTRHAPEVLADLLMGALVAGVSNWCALDDYDAEHELVAYARALIDVLAPNAHSKPD